MSCSTEELTESQSPGAFLVELCTLLLGLAAMLCLVPGCAEPSRATQLLVTVDSEYEAGVDFTALDLEVTRPDGTTQREKIELNAKAGGPPRDLRFPVSFGVGTAGFASGEFVTIEVRSRGARQLHARARTHFIAGRSLGVYLWLSDRCGEVGVECRYDVRGECIDCNSCGDGELDARTLPLVAGPLAPDDLCGGRADGGAEDARAGDAGEATRDGSAGSDGGATEGGASDGATGDGSTGLQGDGGNDRPADAPGERRVVLLESGPDFRCVVLSDQTLHCWGANPNDLLGGGSQLGVESRFVDDFEAFPREVAGLDDVQEVTGLALGEHFGCVVVQVGNVEGQVRCWGANESGQLGTLDTAGRSTPEGVASLTGVTQIDAGSNHVCALRAETATCWGANDSGQTGAQDTQPRLGPVPVEGLEGTVLEVAAGRAHSCAITETGGQRGVWCWGDNHEGQLGDGSWLSSLYPVEVLDADDKPLRGELSQLVAWGDTSCVVRGGDVLCWGESGASVLLGMGYDPVDPTCSTERQACGNAHSVGFFGAVTALDLGPTHACLVQSGRVRCWGSNSQLQLGRSGSRAPSADVLEVAGLIEPAESVSVSATSSCALSDGEVWCWGGNEAGQRASGALHLTELTPVTLPAGTALGLAASSVAATANLCAIVDGDAYCWGDNSVGQLGDPWLATNVQHSQPQQVRLGSASPSQLALGHGFACALVDTPATDGGISGGSVMCWGSNDRGRLGRGDVQDGTTPASVSVLQSDVAEVCTGYKHACARRTDGTIACWGHSTDGALGNPDVEGGYTDTPVDVQGLGPGGAQQVVCGSHHTCALVGQEVLCWGSNFFGQIGNGADWGNAPLPSVVGLEAAGADPVQLAASENATCVLLSDESVWCWGDRDEVGHSDPLPSRLTSPGERIAGGSGLNAIYSGATGMCASDATTLWCWGRNQGGQVVPSAPSQAEGPHAVAGVDPPVRAAALGGGFGCVLDSQGLRCWGSNATGLLSPEPPLATATPAPMVWSADD